MKIDSLINRQDQAICSSGDLLLTLIAWCSAQHSADLAQAGRRQSLADQQHRLL